jgi:RND family efflux transporter MFP subunit
MNKKKVLFPVLVLAGAAVVTAAIFRNRTAVDRQETASPPPTVRVLPVELSDALLVVRSQGSAIPGVDTTLMAQVAGRIAAVGRGFANGGSFRRGEMILQIERRDYELTVAQAEASLAQARVKLDRERAEAELAQSEWGELGVGDVSPLAARQPQLAEAEAALAAAEANLEMARLNLSRTTIKAPFAGRLRRKLSDLGQYVVPGVPLAEVFSTDYAEVPLPIQERELAFLEVDWDSTSGKGPEVEFRGVLGGRSLRWKGRVVRVGNEIDIKTRMMTLYARIDERASLDEGEPTPLPMGMFLDAEIAGRTATAITVLPRSSIREGDRVLVVDTDDRLRFRSVEILRLQDDQALIRTGLEAGERVCVSAIEAPVEGMRVRTVAETTEAERGP